MRSRSLRNRGRTFRMTVVLIVMMLGVLLAVPAFVRVNVRQFMLIAVRIRYFVNPRYVIAARRRRFRGNSGGHQNIRNLVGTRESTGRHRPATPCSWVEDLPDVWLHISVLMGNPETRRMPECGVAPSKGRRLFGTLKLL